MSSFDCLDPKTSLYAHRLIEASAGTGKTFAIEHLVTRFVLDGIPMDTILVVTFTIAATKELRQRISQCLKMALNIIQQEGCREKLPYLKLIVSGSEKDKFRACLLLEKALLDMDQSPICTIHSFCFKYLNREGLLVKNLEARDHGGYKAFYCQKIEEVLSQNRGKKCLATGSLTRLLNAYQGSFDKLYNALIDHLASQSKPNSLVSLEAEKRVITQTIASLCGDFFTRLEFFLPSFKGLYSRSKLLKTTFVKQIKALHSPFTDEKLDLLIVEKTSLFSLLDVSNIKKSISASLMSEAVSFLKVLEPIKEVLEKIRDPRHIFLHLAELCFQNIEADPHKHRHYPPDALITNMVNSLDDEKFTEAISSAFNVAIIDEFQDTDRDQWTIFSSLFSKKRVRAFCLVGDPKQSIYSFRKADVSLFYQAKNQMDTVAHLDTNYRSCFELQTSLNKMFMFRPSWLDMPGIALPYHSIKTPLLTTDSSKILNDGKRAVHFSLYKTSSKYKKTWPSTDLESQVLFPFIAKEILFLHQKEGVDWSKMAVLVKDRFSKHRLASYLSKCSIPYRIDKGGSLFEGPAFDFFSHLILAIIDKGFHHRLNAILTHPFMSADSDDNNVLITPLQWRAHLSHCYQLWNKQGFARSMAYLIHKKVNATYSLKAIFNRRGWSTYIHQMLNIIDQFYAVFYKTVQCMRLMKCFLVSESSHF